MHFVIFEKYHNAVLRVQKCMCYGKLFFHVFVKVNKNREHIEVQLHPSLEMLFEFVDGDIS